MIERNRIVGPSEAREYLAGVVIKYVWRECLIKIYGMQKISEEDSISGQSTWNFEK